MSSATNMTPSTYGVAVNEVVWDRWTDGYTQTASTITGAEVWGNWNDTYVVSSNSTSASTTAATQVWTVWVRDNERGRVITAQTNNISVTGSTNSTGSSVRIWSGWSENYRISNEEFQRRQRVTAEQQARYEAQRAQQEQARIQVEGEKQAARERAAMLLRAHLSEEQRLELADKGYFTIRSIDKNGQTRHYQIRKGFHQNIHEVEPASGRRLNTICAHPQVRVPDEDAMLIQKLMLESPEGHDEFLRIANVSRHYN